MFSRLLFLSPYCIWNDRRYPKITAYTNSIRFIDALRMLEILTLCRRGVKLIPERPAEQGLGNWNPNSVKTKQ